MSCLWCKDEALANDLIKALASPDTPELYIEKSLPDLFQCLDCVNMYHKLKEKYNWTPREKQDLISIEHERIIHHLKKVLEELVSTKKISDIPLEKMNNYRQPILEVLMYPYLALNKDIADIFTLVLEELIKYKKNTLEVDYKCAGIYLLLISSSVHIRKWVFAIISNLPVAEVKDLHILKPIIGAMFNILIHDLLNVVTEEPECINDQMMIKSSTKLPKFLYDKIKKKDLWHAYSVMFKSLQSRTLKIFLMGKRNQNFISLLVNDLQDDNNMFWVILDVVHNLLNKLDSSFWLLPNNVQSPTLLFSLITEHSLYLDYREKCSLIDFEVSKKEHSERRHQSTKLFSWILPFLKSMIGFEKVYSHTMDQIFLFYIDILDNYLKTSDLFIHAAKSFLCIINFLVDINRINLVSSYASKFADILLNLAMYAETKTKVTESTRSLINTIVTQSELIEKTQRLSFQTNFKRMQIKQAYDRNIITSSISLALKGVVTEVKEESDEKEEHAIDVETSEVPMFIDINDDETEEENDDIKERVQSYDDFVEERSRAAYTYTVVDDDDDDVKPDLKLLKPFDGSQSPIPISDDDDDEDFGDDLKGGGIDFQVDLPLFTDDSNSTFDSFSPSEINKHDNKNIDSPNEKFAEKKNAKPRSNKSNADNIPLSGHSKLSSDGDYTEMEKESVFYDISSNIKEASKKKSSDTIYQIPKLKVKSVNLRREKIEMELGNLTNKPNQSEPDIRTTETYNISMLHGLLLSWKPSWLHLNNYELELVNKLYSIPTMFECYDTYMDIFRPLILLESWNYLRTEWDNVDVNPIVCKLDSVENHEDNSHIKCIYEDDISCEYFDMDDLVVVKFKVNDEFVEMFGIITAAQKVASKIQRMLYTLWIKLNSVPILKVYNEVTVTKVAPLSLIFRQWNGLIALKDSLLARDILKPYSKKTYCYEINDIKRKGRLKKLNSRQLQVASAVTRAVATEFSSPRIRLVQGPPGSGKSYTMKTIIAQLLQDWGSNNLRNSVSVANRSRILVCAPSNTALDELMKRMISSPPRIQEYEHVERKEKNCGDFNIIRVGGDLVHKELRQFTLDYLVSNQMKKHGQNDILQDKLRDISQTLDSIDALCLKLKIDSAKKDEYVTKMKERAQLQCAYNKLSRKYAASFNYHLEEEKCERYLLLNADIVFCTLSEAGSRCMLQTFKNYIQTPFKCLFIDEAHMCTEPQCLIPLQYGVSKVVLFGDVLKLPVPVFSQKSAQYNYGQSLFSRLHYALLQNNIPRSALTLQRQYRLSSEISSFPSKQFYGDNLKPVKEGRSHDSFIQLKSYVVINHDHNINPYNYVSTRKHCTAICESIISKGFNPHGMGIIVVDNKQGKLLKDQLKNNGLEDIFVDTVEGFQGKEKEVIILCCHQEPNSQQKSFLANKVGMNIALTKAKQSLIIIGTCAQLERNEDWKSLRKDAISRRVYYDVSSIKDTLECIFSQKPKDEESSKKIAPVSDRGGNHMGLKKTSSKDFKSSKEFEDEINVLSEVSFERVETNIPPEFAEVPTFPFQEDDVENNSKGDLTNNSHARNDIDLRVEMNSSICENIEKESVGGIKKSSSSLSREKKEISKKPTKSYRGVEGDESKFGTKKKRRGKKNSSHLPEKCQQRKLTGGNAEPIGNMVDLIKRRKKEELINASQLSSSIIVKDKNRNKDGLVSGSSARKSDTKIDVSDITMSDPDDNTLDKKEEQIVISSPEEIPTSQTDLIQSTFQYSVLGCMPTGDISPKRIDEKTPKGKATEIMAAEEEVPDMKAAGVKAEEKRPELKATEVKVAEEKPANVKATGDQKHENVKLSLSIKLLTKEKLSCNDPVKEKALQEALEKLESLLDTPTKQELENQEVCPVNKKLPVPDDEKPPLPTNSATTPPRPDNISIVKHEQTAVSFDEKKFPLPKPPLPPSSYSPTTQTSPSSGNSKSDKNSDIESMHRSPSSSGSSFTGDPSVRHDVLPHTHKDGFTCVEICRDARWEPSQSYFKFPHRHSDGTLCQTHCHRVHYRERWKKEEGLVHTPKPQVPANITWKLIPLDIPSKSNTCSLSDPRMNDDPNRLSIERNTMNKNDGKFAFPDQRCNLSKPTYQASNYFNRSRPVSRPVSLNVSANVEPLEPNATHENSVESNTNSSNTSQSFGNQMPGNHPLDPRVNISMTKEESKYGMVDMQLAGVRGSESYDTITPTYDDRSQAQISYSNNVPAQSPSVTIEERNRTVSNEVNEPPNVRPARTREGTPTLDERTATRTPSVTDKHETMVSYGRNDQSMVYTAALTTDTHEIVPYGRNDQSVVPEQATPYIRNYQSMIPGKTIPYVRNDQSILSEQNLESQASSALVRTISAPLSSDTNQCQSYDHYTGQPDKYTESYVSRNKELFDNLPTTTNITRNDSDMELSESGSGKDSPAHVATGYRLPTSGNMKSTRDSNTVVHDYTKDVLLRDRHCVEVKEGCSTPTRDEQINPLVLLSNSDNISDNLDTKTENRVDKFMADVDNPVKTFELNPFAGIDPEMVPRLKEMGSAEAISFAMKQDSAQAVPCAIKQALVSTLQPSIRTLPQMQQESILNYAAGYFAALLEKLIQSGGSDMLFKNFSKMIQWSASNAHNAFMRTLPPGTNSSTSNRQIEPAEVLSKPDNVDCRVVSKPSSSTFKPSIEPPSKPPATGNLKSWVEKVDANEIDDIISKLRNSSSYSREKGLDSSKREDVRNIVIEKSSTAESYDSTKHIEHSEQQNIIVKTSPTPPSEASLPRQRTKPTYGPRLPSNFSASDSDGNEDKYHSRSNKANKQSHNRKRNYSPEGSRHSSDHDSSSESALEGLPKQQKYNDGSPKTESKYLRLSDIYRKRDSNKDSNRRDSNNRDSRNIDSNKDCNKDSKKDSNKECENSFARRFQNTYLIEDDNMPPPQPDTDRNMHPEYPEYSERHNDFFARTTVQGTPRSDRRYTNESPESPVKRKSGNTRKRVRFNLPDAESSEERSDSEPREPDRRVVHKRQHFRGRVYRGRGSRGRRGGWL